MAHEDEQQPNFVETEEIQKFGFSLDQDVEVIAEGTFRGQETHIVAFTADRVVVMMAGPLGKPDFKQSFEPKGLRPLPPS